ncbi:hypothetical protein B0J11DRAFT_574069 [Dendryphion nanum]|uniref:BTB domain-containing protein n=1 Tax=Dendryphion nanum TaxID=256645 RepID=A0A9P9EGZ3_9PLEO|nr:hypothetical protein B0J11DRAFT_574069 [Dendryphion nanum]
MASKEDLRAAEKPRMACLDFGEANLVKLNVGQGDVNSGFFRRALSGNWKEAHDGAIDFHEDDPQTFAKWLHFAHLGHIPGDSSNATKVRNNVGGKITELCRLYVLADRLLDISAQNAIICSIFDLSELPHASDSMDTILSAEAIIIAYEGTLDGNPLRKLMVDLWSNAEATFLVGKCAQFPPQFLLDLCVVTLNDRPRTRFSIASRKGRNSYLR